tara:strand:+ start:2851 stop:3096 length:246 start_codon:yes stop_codon:yes gene_type:complete
MSNTSTSIHRIKEISTTSHRLNDEGTYVRDITIVSQDFTFDDDNNKVWFDITNTLTLFGDSESAVNLIIGTPIESSTNEDD